MKNKIILDLCGGTGSWGKVWEENEFTVHNITFPEYDIMQTVLGDDYLLFSDSLHKKYLKIAIQDIYGILAAPPCTQFSWARTNAKNPRNLRAGMAVVQKCLEIVWHIQTVVESDQQKYPPLKFWALENPFYGMLRWYLGKPAFVFDPWEFGHNYKKKTAIWGYFKEPIKTHKIIDEVMTEEDKSKSKSNSRKLPKFDYLTMDELKKVRTVTELESWKNSKTRQALRGITPRGFAEAFFNANK